MVWYTRPILRFLQFGPGAAGEFRIVPVAHCEDTPLLHEGRPVTFVVNIPFGPFDAGQSCTAAEVLARVPGADVDRLVRLGSLIPPAGVAAVLVPVPVTAEEADLVAELQQRLTDAEADRDLERETATRLTAERDALAKRVQELETAAEKADKGRQGGGDKGRQGG